MIYIIYINNYIYTNGIIILLYYSKRLIEGNIDKKTKESKTQPKTH